MTTKLFTLLLCAALLSFSSCKKDDSSDLTVNAVGHYTNATTETDITVTKVDGKTISIFVAKGHGSGYDEYTIAKAIMSSENAFAIEPIAQDGFSCNGTETISGTGSCSNGSISVIYTIDGVGDGAGYSECSDKSGSFSASK